MTMQIDAPEADAPEINTEVLEEIQSLYGGSLEAADYRGDAPEGAILAESEVEGSIFRIKKGSSLAKNKGQPLPARTVVYDTRTGVISKVPTRSLYYHLGKKRQDGTRVYSLRMPPNITPPTPIEDTCLICLRNRNGVKRNFYSEFDLLNHMQLFHEREWNAMERDREINTRREDAGRLERLVLMLATAMRPDVADKLPEDVREQISQMQDLAAAQQEERPNEPAVRRPRQQRAAS